MGETRVSDVGSEWILDAVAEPVLVCDGSGHLQHANPAARALLGEPIPDILLRTIRQDTAQSAASGAGATPDEPAPVGGAAPPGSGPGRSRLRLRAADGSELTLELDVRRLDAPGSDPDAPPSRLLGTLRVVAPAAGAAGGTDRPNDLPRIVQAVARAATALSGGLDLDQALQLAVRTLVYDCDAALARVWLLDPADGTLCLRASAGLTEQVDGDVLARVDPEADPTELGQVARSRRPLVRAVAPEAGRIDARAPSTAISALVVLPLISGGELRGVLLHAARRPPEPAVVEALTGFAAIVAAAVRDELIVRREQAARIEAEDQRRKLQTILDTVSVGVLLAEGPEAHLSVTNPAARAILGREVAGASLDWFLANHPARGLDGQPVADAARPFSRAFRDHQRVRETLRLSRADGSEVVLDLMAAPFPGPEGGAITTFADITDRLQLEAELGERAAQFKALLDHLPVGVAYFDARGVCRASNGPARRILGRVRREITGAPAPELFATRPALADALGRCIATSTPHSDDGVPWADEPGSIRYLDWRFEPLPRSDAGVNQGALALIVDVTERALAEFALQRAAEAAESASRRKTQFLSAVSHDLRTPVNALSLQAELLGLLLGPAEEDSELHQLTDDMRKVAANLIELINDLLDLTRFDSGEIDYLPSVFPLDEFLERTLLPMSATAAAKGLQFRWQADRPGRTVRGDRVKLARVLGNLASNAVKFTDRGGVEIEAGAGADGGLRLAVHDTGPGIPEAQLERIFDEFAQLRNPERDRTKGTGLGLAICRRLVEGLGGRLSVESRLDAGSSFRVEYPAALMSADAGAPHPTPPAGPEPGEAPGGLPILLVEDDSNSRKTLARLLGHAGYRVETADDGPSALAALERSRPALVLLDLMMPGMDGGEVLRRLRADPRTADLKVVLITGDLIGIRSAELTAMNVDGFLPKPVDFNGLLEMVARLASPKAPVVARSAPAG